MKFNDGLWMTRPGFSLHRGMEIRDYDITDDAIILYVPTIPINHRGATLRGPLLTITFSSPMKDIIGVRIEHFTGDDTKKPSFQLPQNNPTVEIYDQENELIMVSGRSRVVIKKEGLPDYDFYYDEQHKTASRGLGSVAYISEGEYMAQKQNLINDLQLPEFPETSFIRQNLVIGVQEHLYGMGERFTPFVRNGQTVDIWQADGGTSSEQSYKNIPFYVSDRGYGILANHPEKVSFEVGSINTARVEMSVAGEHFEYFYIGGETLKAVLGTYTDFTGKPQLPPAWSYGLWLSTSFTTNYDEDTVNHFIDGMIEREIPLSVFHYDCFWMKEYQWCDFEWDSRYFPDPEGMLKRLKEKDLHICVWINPYIGQKSPLFKEAKEHGYLLKSKDGKVWQWDQWQPGMALVDFTNKEACDWYAAKLSKLVGMGVDCFKTDFGERVPVDVVYADGSDPYRMHNYYTYLYNELVFNVLEKNKGSGQACLFARSATVGTQKFPVHWGGDCDATYESMAETLRGGLSFGLSGFAFWSHDIGGFEATATADLYKRWVAFGLMSSHSRLHGSGSYRVPWLFDDEASEVLRYFTQLKCQLMPYIYQQSVEGCQFGLPVMRAMVLEFPDDPNCSVIDTQFMVGDALLAAPIFNEEGMACFYVPAGEGDWTDFLTGKVYKEGCWYKEKMDYFRLPLLLRPGYAVAVGNTRTKPDYDYADHVTIYISASDKTMFNKTVIVSDNNGQEQLAFKFEGSLTDELKISTQAYYGDATHWEICLIGSDEPQKYKAEKATVTTLADQPTGPNRKSLLVIPETDTLTIQINK